MTTSAEEIKALPTAHFVDWLERYAGSLRYGDPPTNGNDIAFLEVARRLSEMEAENKRLREALRNLCASLDRLGDNGVHLIDTGLAHAYAASLAALEHQQKGEGL